MRVYLDTFSFNVEKLIILLFIKLSISVSHAITTPLAIKKYPMPEQD